MREVETGKGSKQQQRATFFAFSFFIRALRFVEKVAEERKTRHYSLSPPLSPPPLFDWHGWMDGRTLFRYEYVRLPATPAARRLHGRAVGLAPLEKRVK
jgi:hypothetical protein